MRSSPLKDLRRGQQVIVVCGTGGVGKTTVSAALALAAALEGRRALVMTIDPARRLADSLGVAGMLDEATPIDLEALLPGDPRLKKGGRLHAMMLDPKSTWDGVVERFAKDEQAKRRILDNPYYQTASESLSGTQEYMAMERLLQVQSSGEYDLIVLDTPPTRNAMDFLRAPGRMLAVLQQGAISWVLDDEEREGKGERRRRSVKLFGAGGKLLLSVFQRFTGLEVLEGIGEFVTSFGSLLSGFRSRAAEVMALLKSERCAFVMVASPSRVALNEGLYFHDRLAQADLRFRGFVINRVRSAPATSDSELPRTAWEAGLPHREDPAWIEAANAIWDHHLAGMARAEVERGNIAALREHCGPGLPYVEIPEFEGEVHDVEALERLVDYL